jgi:hypothetical protein
MEDHAYGQALLTCDAVARDPTGKITLYGIFDRIWSRTFPAVHGSFSIYWRCVIPAPGRVGVAILRPDGSTLLELEPAETSKESIHSLQGTYTLGAFEFPIEGDYTMVLRYNNITLLRSVLSLSRVQQ